MQGNYYNELVHLLPILGSDPDNFNLNEAKRLHEELSREQKELFLQYLSLVANIPQGREYIAKNPEEAYSRLKIAYNASVIVMMHNPEYLQNVDQLQKEAQEALDGQGWRKARQKIVSTAAAGTRKLLSGVQAAGRISGDVISEVAYIAPELFIVLIVLAGGGFLVYSERAGVNYDGQDLTEECSTLESVRTYNSSFQDSNLNGCDLSGVEMHWSDLSRAQAKKVLWPNANLSNSEMDQVDFSGANLNSANLYGADMTQANFTGATLNLANAGSADLLWTNLDKVNAEGINLSDADLKYASFVNANLAGSTWSGSNVQNVDFSNANLTGAKFGDISESATTIEGATLAGANLSGASFVNAEIEGVDFRKAELGNGIYINETALTDVKFSCEQLPLIQTGSDQELPDQEGCVADPS